MNNFKLIITLGLGLLSVAPLVAPRKEKKPEQLSPSAKPKAQVAASRGAAGGGGLINPTTISRMITDVRTAIADAYELSARADEACHSYEVVSVGVSNALDAIDKILAEEAQAAQAKAEEAQKTAFRFRTRAERRTWYRKPSSVAQAVTARQADFVTKADGSKVALPAIDASAEDLEAFLLKSVYQNLFFTSCKLSFAKGDFENLFASGEDSQRAQCQIEEFVCGKTCFGDKACSCGKTYFLRIGAACSGLIDNVAYAGPEVLKNPYQKTLLVIGSLIEYHKTLEAQKNILERCKQHLNITQAARRAEKVFDRRMEIFLRGPSRA